MTSNRTAYAVWSINSYKLTIINPKSVLGQSTTTFDYNSDVSTYLEAQKLTVPGYTFDKYIDSSTGEPVNFTKMPARDVILTATYTSNSINFKMFYLKEGSGTTLDDCAVDSFIQPYNEKNMVEGFNQLPEYRDIDPYEFKYWATNYVNGRTLVYNIEDNVSYLKQFSTSQIMPTVDTSFYAIYALSKSKLVLTEEDAGRVTISDGYDKEDPLTWFSKNGFKFDGASLEGLLTFSVTDPLRTGDVVQRVTFSCNDVSYVFYVGNGNHWVTNGVHLFLTEDGLYHIYYQGLNQEGTKYALQIQDTKKTIVSIEGIFKYEFISSKYKVLICLQPAKAA